MNTRVITKNIISSYLSKAWIGIVAFLCTPYLVKQLGADAYGILSLSILIIGYSVLLDFGLGRGIVKYIAEYNILGKAERVRKLVRSSLTIYFIVGFLSAIILSVFTKLFLNKIFKIPSGLYSNAVIVFYITAFSLFFRLPQTLFQSIAIGYQKIYMLNIINTIFDTMKIITSIVILYLGYFLVAVVAAYVLLGVVQLIVLYLFSRGIIPKYSISFGFDKTIVKKVLLYSFKTFTADSLGMLITYIDKIIIGVFLPIANLTFYIVPFEFTARIWGLQVAAVSVTLPNFSEYSAANLSERFNKLYIKITKFIAIISAFLSSVLCFFSKEILTYWISPDFALKGEMVLKISSWGILTSSILSIAGIVSYGAGRLKIPIKTNAVMLFLHICLCIVFIHFLGISGVALSWIFIHIVGICIITPWINKVIIKIDNIKYLLEVLRPITISIAVVGLTYIVYKRYIDSLMGLVISVVTSGILYIIIVYSLLLIREERRYILRLIPGFVG